MLAHGAWTGVSPGEGTGATMSDDEDDQVDSDANLFDGSLDGSDMGFGPLIPTETERSLMERVRQELKHELKQVIDAALIPIFFPISSHVTLWPNLFFFFCLFNFRNLGLQGENCGHKRGNFAQETSRETSW